MKTTWLSAKVVFLALLMSFLSCRLGTAEGDPVRLKNLQSQALAGFANLIESLKPPNASLPLPPEDEWALLVGMAGKEIDMHLIDEVYISDAISSSTESPTGRTHAHPLSVDQAIFRRAYLPSKISTYQQIISFVFEHLNDDTRQYHRCRLEIVITIAEDRKMTIKRFFIDETAGGERVELSGFTSESSQD